jgi:hypothetical protein
MLPNKIGIESDVEIRGPSDVPGVNEDLKRKEPKTALDAVFAERPMHFEIEYFRGAHLFETPPSRLPRDDRRILIVQRRLGRSGSGSFVARDQVCSPTDLGNQVDGNVSSAPALTRRW